MDHSNEKILTKEYCKVKLILDGGISQELVTENHKNLCTELICSICLEIVRSPKLCKTCQNLFCNECLTQQLSKSKFCPNRCIFKDQEVNLIFKKLLFKIELKCYYCKNGCNETILYENFDKHVENCIWGNYKCMSPGCNFISNLNIIKIHIGECNYKLILCECCKSQIQKYSFEKHFQECSQKPVTCEYCLKIFINKEYIVHKDICEEFELQCKQCFAKFLRKESHAHSENICLRNQVDYWKAKYENCENEKNELSQKVKIFNSNSIEKFLSNNGSNNNNSNNSNQINHLSQVTQVNNGIIHRLLNNNSNDNNDVAIDNSASLIIEANQQIAIHDMENLSIQEYKASIIKTLRGMSGLVYTIVDLSAYKSNLGAIGNYNTILIFNLLTTEKYVELVGHASYIWSIIHLSDYKLNYIASASQDNTIKIWNLDTNSYVKTLNGHTNWVTTIQLFKFDSKILISASYDHNIKFWNLDSGDCMKTIGSVFGKGVLNAFYDKESYIVYGSVGNCLKVYDYQDDTEKFVLRGHTNLVNCFSNLGLFNSSYIASGSDDKTVKIWNLNTGELVFNLTGHRECINSLVHLNSFNINLLASVSDDRTIRIWNLSRFECVSQLNFHSSWVKSIMHIKSVSDYFYSHGDTGSVVCWKLERNNNLNE